MYILDESIVRSVAFRDLVRKEVSKAFVCEHLGTAKLFSVLHANGTCRDTSVSVKSGFERESKLVGLKVGTYWPANKSRGIPAHGSTTILIDDLSGKVRAIVSAAYLNCLRTAAAAALSVQYLARTDSRVLSVIGAGNQAAYNVVAICDVMEVERILIHSRTESSATSLRDRFSDLAESVEVVGIQQAVESADVLVTATTSLRPLFETDWVRSGTQITAMGADRKGKQELPPTLLDNASLFADSVEQSVRIGEFQHLTEERGRVISKAIHPLGEIIQKQAIGRRQYDEITIFDSSGIATQDLFVADAVLRKALKAGIALEIPDP